MQKVVFKAHVEVGLLEEASETGTGPGFTGPGSVILTPRGQVGLFWTLLLKAAVFRQSKLTERVWGW